MRFPWNRSNPMRKTTLRALTFWLCASMFLAALPSPARAAEPRPWLCRDKPVFSDSHPMSYKARAQKGREWHIFLMQFSPGAGHDGFEIVKTIELPHGGGETGGQIPPGQYYAVALYHQASGYWICPAYASEQSPPPLGVIRSLCFSDTESGCKVKLTLSGDNTTQSPAP